MALDLLHMLPHPRHLLPLPLSSLRLGERPFSDPACRQRNVRGHQFPPFPPRSDRIMRCDERGPGSRPRIGHALLLQGVFIYAPYPPRSGAFGYHKSFVDIETTGHIQPKHKSFQLTLILPDQDVLSTPTLVLRSTLTNALTLPPLTLLSVNIVNVSAPSITPP